MEAICFGKQPVAEYPRYAGHPPLSDFSPSVARSCAAGKSFKRRRRASGFAALGTQVGAPPPAKLLPGIGPGRKTVQSVRPGRAVTLELHWMQC